MIYFYCLKEIIKYFYYIYCLDVGAYSLPIVTSIYWLVNQNPHLEIKAISVLLMTFKFLLFFRVFQSYGNYFVGVAEEVFPFLVVLFFIIL